MNRYITSIKINKLYHLHNFSIAIEDDRKPHLFITGKNGSGKTVLLGAIADFFEKIKDDTNFNFLNYQKNIDNLFGKVELAIDSVVSIIEKYQKGEFVLAFYAARREVNMDKVKSIHKPQLQEKMSMEQSATKQFLYYLTDLKFQEALARNEGHKDDADKIKAWFDDFEHLLSKIFGDEGLKLEFNYKSYDFLICTSDGKQFDFNHLSDGYAAIIDVVVDLIMRMQAKNSLTRAYEKQGIVLIDEIETHLHLQLQKDIMPMLTKVFPNIQFIVTTHSPFVLSSINNAVAYDLEHQQPISDLSQYSYSALVEGYFKVDTEPSYLSLQLDAFEHLLEKDGELSASEMMEAKEMKREFDNLPEWTSPNSKARYQDLLISMNDKIKSFGL